MTKSHSNEITPVDIQAKVAIAEWEGCRIESNKIVDRFISIWFTKTSSRSARRAGHCWKVNFPSTLSLVGASLDLFSQFPFRMWVYVVEKGSLNYYDVLLWLIFGASSQEWCPSKYDWHSSKNVNNKLAFISLRVWSVHVKLHKHMWKCFLHVSSSVYCARYPISNVFSYSTTVFYSYGRKVSVKMLAFVPFIFLLDFQT